MGLGINAGAGRKEMEKITALVLVLFVISSQVERVVPAVTDCLDACSTGCVQKDTRLMQRCEGKCKIKCDPGVKADVGTDSYNK